MTEPLTIDKLADEVRPMAGQVCLLYRSELARLIGVAEDRDDLYYVVRLKSGSEPLWLSAVGHIDPLKGHVPDEVYEGLSAVFTLNGAAPEEFQVIRHDPSAEDSASPIMAA
ncbi:hypothetical protein [Defluviimonas salinarum]|uniref:Uncharacterized protein n=1 Tax=Defluviimonas salinarum TaxID=2992147 RepID=A0ABT3J5H4_9RHOB|nr:hypothetical protein [Defluviimonas salinarum]MCW3782942.1 hypothetical protein [Defluviimonas salinarum]